MSAANSNADIKIDTIDTIDPVVPEETEGMIETMTETTAAEDSAATSLSPGPRAPGLPSSNSEQPTANSSSHETHPHPSNTYLIQPPLLRLHSHGWLLLL